MGGTGLHCTGMRKQTAAGAHASITVAWLANSTQQAEPIELSQSQCTIVDNHHPGGGSKLQCEAPPYILKTIPLTQITTSRTPIGSVRPADAPSRNSTAPLPQMFQLLPLPCSYEHTESR